MADEGASGNGNAHAGDGKDGLAGIDEQAPGDFSKEINRPFHACVCGFKEVARMPVLHTGDLMSKLFRRGPQYRDLSDEELRRPKEMMCGFAWG